MNVPVILTWLARIWRFLRPTVCSMETPLFKSDNVGSEESAPVKSKRRKA